MNKDLYGPSLREIANHFFPDDGLPVEVDLFEDDPNAIKVDLDDVVEGLPPLRPSDVPLVSEAPTKDALFALISQKQRIQSAHKPYAKGLVRPGRLIWFDSIKSDQPSVKQQIEFESALGVVLDCPATDVNPSAWYGWIASPYSAYATWWDVLIDTCEDGQSFDTSACAIHARQRVIVFPALASCFSVSISMTDVARIQAVTEEFLKVTLQSTKVVFLDPDHDGIRKTLGDLKVRTGSLVKSDTDPRIAFAKIISVVCSEVTELSYAHAFALQAVPEPVDILSFLQKMLPRLRFLNLNGGSTVRPQLQVGAAAQMPGKQVVHEPLSAVKSLQWSQDGRDWCMEEWIHGDKKLVQIFAIDGNGPVPKAIYWKSAADSDHQRIEIEFLEGKYLVNIERLRFIRRVEKIQSIEDANTLHLALCPVVIC